MIRIPLKHGLVVLVDDEDVGALDLHLTATSERAGHYAVGYIPREGGGMKQVKLHRWVMGVLDDPSKLVDHINGDPMDNRRANLRLVSRVVNARNSSVVRTGTGFRGVTKVPRVENPYQARIMVNRKQVRLGAFPTAEAAHEARLAAERKYWGIEPRRAEAHGVEPPDVVA